MKKILKILLIVDACVAVIFLFGGMIMEILRAIPFSKNSTFDLIWYIFYGGAYITGAPFLIIFIVCFIKILYLIFDYPHKHYTFKYFAV